MKVFLIPLINAAIIALIAHLNTRNVAQSDDGNR